jgi:hypothetical protein
MSIDDPFEIPAVLRRYQISEDLLDKAIGQLRLADQSLLADRLEGVKNTDLFCNTTGTNNTAVGHNAGINVTTGTNNTAVGNEADTSSHVRLTKVLKERTAQEILSAVKEGHDTYGKLKKYGLSDERVLKASIRYALTHRVSSKSRLVKLSPRTYGVENG